MPPAITAAALLWTDDDGPTCMKTDRNDGYDCLGAFKNCPHYEPGTRECLGQSEAYAAINQALSESECWPPRRWPVRGLPCKHSADWSAGLPGPQAAVGVAMSMAADIGIGIGIGSVL